MFAGVVPPSLSEPNVERGSGREPIAIIGIGCRFPGSSGPAEFWQLLRDGVDAITEIPPDRFAVDSVYDPEPGTPGKIINRAGGFLRGIDQFDASFFGISPREASRMDPQHRLLLEVTWEALEDAGLTPPRLAGSDTGVFIGATTADYEDIQYHLRDRSEIDLHVATGTARSVLSGRISYFFDLQGPSLTVDTACSSSLVAAHLACESLWNGESRLAIAGGVNLILLPELSMPFSRARMLAADSRCRFGDATASGFVRSDGIGVVLLKPLSKAQADQDHIYAVIVGTAINNDGRSSGLLATPSSEGQQAVLRKAYRNAGLSPGDVQYVEAHGTGTSAGDPIEVQSLGTVLAAGRPPNHRCLLGSVKTNIGHTEGAAGIAGLIKVALCLKHRAIPPSLHFDTPNPVISWHELPLEVCKALTAWPAGPAVAGVSAFGISATNAHLVMQEAPQSPTYRTPDTGPDRRAHILTLSARAPEALAEMARAYLALARTDDLNLRDVCYSANVRKTHHDHRLAIVAHSRAELGDQLQAFLDNEIRPNVADGEQSSASVRKLVFVFPGQGSQWLGMGRQLMEQEPFFKSALARCEAAIRQHVAWSLMAELAAEASRSRLGEIDVVQPCLFAIQVALAELWQHWGFAPDAVVGQSMGEIAAAHVAGALSLEDAAQIICRRSLLLKRVSGRGGMAVVGLSYEAAQQALARFGDHLSIAVSSSPTSTVIAGDTEPLQEMMQALKSAGVFCQQVNVDVASHSPQMDALRDDLLEALAGINPQPAAIPVYSTVTGDVAHDLTFDAEYWAANLRRPVLFSRAVQSLLNSGHNSFIELSPHPLLSSPIQQAAPHTGQEALVLCSLRHDEDERAVMLGSVGALYAAGYAVEWARLHPAGGRFIQPPLYPWQRERFWLGPEETKAHRSNAGMAPDHLLATASYQSAADPGVRFWEFSLSTDAFPFLKDHSVQGVVVLPAAAYMEMAIAAGRSLFAEGELVLERVDFKKALTLTGEARIVQLVIASQTSGKATFEFFSRESAEGQDSWTLHATGTIRVAEVEAPPMAQPIEEIKPRCNYIFSQSHHYESLAKRGLQYGPCFQGVKRLWKDDGMALAEINLPQAAARKASRYHIHPALLDSCFQALAATLPMDQTDSYLPVGLESLRIYQRPGCGVWAYARLREGAAQSAEVLKGDLSVLDQDGQVLLRATGLSMKRLGQEQQARRENQGVEQLLYDLEWKSGSRPQLTSQPQQSPGAWIVFSEGGAIAHKLIDALESAGESCVIVSAGESYAEIGPGHYQINAARLDDYAQLLSELFGLPERHYRGVVHLWSLKAVETNDLSSTSLEGAQTFGCRSVLLLVQALAQAGQSKAGRLWLVTRAAQSVTGDESLSVAQSPLWGLGRVIAQEHPSLHCSLVDLGAASAQEIKSLMLELRAADGEDQVALRGEGHYVARLVHRDTADLTQPDKVDSVEGHDFRLAMTRPGILDTLRLRETPRAKPGSGEIAIAVRAVGLNFRDVMLAMGVLPSAPNIKEDFGWECAGRVVGIGDGVDEFKIGDEVLALAHPCFGAYVTTPACLTLHKPARLSFEEAATMPLACLTAHYSLNVLGRLQRRERVLIHSASGGVGLAAIRIAQQQEAEVFATAGSDEKRRFLKSLGIRHVFDSRTLSFADEILEVTGGEGVDMVLNSLAGEAIPASLSILRSGGRFLELGRQDIYKNAKLGLEPFRKNLAFFAIDLACLIRQNPAYIGSLLREAIGRFENNSGSLPPLRAFSMADIADGFRLMANAKHIGKIALRVHGEKVAVMPSAKEAFRLRPDGAYLITGGLGGLGLSVARQMIAQGARHLVLVGRTPGSRAAREAVEAMREMADVVVEKADVSHREEISSVLAGIQQRTPPLRGVVHAAGLLDDGILLQMDRCRFDNVMAPKIQGAWNLHSLTLDAPLDFFVLFSSAAVLLGSAGQGNYSAANAFLDCLAHYRKSQGLPALSINWGPWAEVGLAAEGHRGERLAQRGIGSLTRLEGLKVFEQLLNCHRRPQVAVMDFDFEQWNRRNPAAAGSAFFAEVAERPYANRPVTEKAGVRLTRDVLLAADCSERKTLLESYLKAVLGRAVGFDKSHLNRLDARQPINRFGLDSLMALEMKTRIEADTGVVIPIIEFLKGASLAQLATKVLDQLSTPAPAREARAGRAAAGGGAAQQWEELTI
jgi:acyl transferase domain-containing protein/acyl carrier protein